MLGKYIKLGGAVAGGRGRDTNRYTSSGALRIAYELQGTMHRRRPWLVLVHGMVFDRSGWDPVLPALRRRFRLVLLDNRGTGRSGRPDGSFNVADMAADVVAVLVAEADGAWAATNVGAHRAAAIATAKVLNEKQGRFLIGTSSNCRLVCLQDPLRNLDALARL